MTHEERAREWLARDGAVPEWIESKLPSLVDLLRAVERDAVREAVEIGRVHAVKNFGGWPSSENYAPAHMGGAIEILNTIRAAYPEYFQEKP